MNITLMTLHYMNIYFILPSHTEEIYMTAREHNFVIPLLKFREHRAPCFSPNIIIFVYYLSGTLCYLISLWSQTIATKPVWCKKSDLFFYRFPNHVYSFSMDTFTRQIPLCSRVDAVENTQTLMGKSASGTTLVEKSFDKSL